MNNELRKRTDQSCQSERHGGPFCAWGEDLPFELEDLKKNSRHIVWVIHDVSHNQIKLEV